MTEVSGLVPIIEAALLAAGKPLTIAGLGALFEEHERPDNDAIRSALSTIGERCEDRGFELTEVASGWRFQVRETYSQWVSRLWQERPQKYSRALLETLALVAYRQPITRGEIEEIRGVAVSTNIIRTLHERDWIRVVGHRDVPGRPAMYATTRQFLDYFNLKSLDQLPALADLRDLETLNAELGFEPLEAESEATDEPQGDIAETAEASDRLDERDASEEPEDEVGVLPSGSDDVKEDDESSVSASDAAPVATAAETPAPVAGEADEESPKAHGQG